LLGGELGPAEVHVWSVRASSSAVVDACRAHLSVEETARASRFLSERDQCMAAVSRGFRRLLLAQYTGQAAHELRFEEGPQGKPSLANSTGVCFNVSHSGDLAMFAVVRERNIGIDIERVRAEPDLRGIARQSFSAREQRELDSLPPSAWTTAFYQCWTQKEAFIKLVGAGLQFSLEAFDVNVDPTKPAALLGIRAPAPNALPCGLMRINAPRGYAAALAIHGTTLPVRHFGIP